MPSENLSEIYAMGSVRAGSSYLSLFFSFCYRHYAFLFLINTYSTTCCEKELERSSYNWSVKSQHMPFLPLHFLCYLFLTYIRRYVLKLSQEKLTFFAFLCTPTGELTYDHTTYASFRDSPRTYPRKNSSCEAFDIPEIQDNGRRPPSLVEILRD